MEFKRLNNMTGRDAILNRRIASIFISEFENFIQLLKLLPSEPTADNIRFNLHKLRPSFVIFEMDKLLKSFEILSERKTNGDIIQEDDSDLINAIEESNLQLKEVKSFLDQL